MLGTLVNTTAILVGSAIGLTIDPWLPARFKTTLMKCLGLATMVIGLDMALAGRQELLTAVGCLLLGGMLGEALNIEQRLNRLGDWLKRRLRLGGGDFTEGFVTATLLYLTGAMTLVGSIRDGAVGDHSLLFLKALLDGVASIALASSLGIGVLFSALPVLLVQGGLTLLASQLLFLSEPAVLTAVNITGGILILGIGINLLELGYIPVGNLLPALVCAIIAALVL